MHLGHRGWALCCIWRGWGRKWRVFKGENSSTVKGSPACSATVLPFSSTHSLPFFGTQN